MEDVVGPREVQARTACLEGEDEKVRRLLVILKALYHCIPPSPGYPSVEEGRLLRESRFQIRAQDLPHLAELGEEQRPLPALQYLLQHLRQALELARAAGDLRVVLEEMGGRVQDLLQL